MTRAFLTVLIPLLTLGLAAAADEGIATYQGRVVELASAPSEGGLESVLATVEGAGVRHRVLLAPERTLAQAGFDVRVGDEVRVRVFVDGTEQVLVAHKIMNMTRGTMVRLRTLHRIPAWDASGAWQGGQGNGFGPGPRGGHGRGPRR
jgi:hypothetical protein